MKRRCWKVSVYDAGIFYRRVASETISEALEIVEEHYPNCEVRGIKDLGAIDIEVERKS